MENISQKLEWYRFPEKEVLNRLNSSEKGLSQDEAHERLKHFGQNKLPVKKAPSIPRIFLNQLINPLIYILIVAGIVSLVIGDNKDAFFIFVVIFINSVIGGYQEWKAEKSSEALRNLLRLCVKTKRNGEKKSINAVYLVPGDIVLVESGEKVPADLRILKQVNLVADESLLTGESTDIMKSTETLDEELPLSDRNNMLYAGSIVTSGRGVGVVVATGLNTEIGKIAVEVTSLELTKPPLIRRMERFSKQISLVVLFACAIIAVVQMARGGSIIEVFFLAVALAVSSIPEGLPAALTIALSVGTSRMAKRNVIVRKLPAVEGLGSCTLIASDKTGTLTVNKQTVKLLYMPDGKRYKVTGEGYSGEGEIIPCRTSCCIADTVNLVRAAVICNEGHLIKKDGKWVSHGDAVDIAFIALGYKYGMHPEEIKEDIHVVKEIPFESEKRFSAVFFKENEVPRVAVKGAFEVISHFCSQMKMGENTVPIDKKRVERQITALSATGHRVIALAEGDVPHHSTYDYTEQHLEGLTFLGLIGLIDPLRPEARCAVDVCRDAGVKVIMITGDHPETAFTIAKNLDIVETHDQVVNGSELDKFQEDSEDFDRIVNNASVFARVTPLQKLSIIESLIKAGNFIAVTGDGVNDAPALKKAHIGVAMGSGTDVAKDVSSMIVVDDNFASVVAGIEEGRYAYDNIRKAVYLLVATGFAEIVLFMFALFSNLPVPLVAVQLLWLNLVTNGIQGIALAFEKGEKETMKKPPRKPEEGIFNPLMIQEIMISGISMGFIAYLLWLILLDQGLTEFSARNYVLLLMVFFENIHTFNARSEYKSAFRVPIRNNILLITSVIAAQIIHVVSMNIPVMQFLLDIEPISVQEWLYLLVTSASVLVIMEVYKFLKFRKV